MDSKYLPTDTITTRVMMDSMMTTFQALKEAYPNGYQYIHDNDKLLDLLALSDNLSAPEKNAIKVQIATNEIGSKVKEFEAKVWFKGLQDQILATTTRGVSAKLGKKDNNFCVLTWSGMGRTMITIEDDTASVTCVADETSKTSRTGFHGISATAQQALALYDKAIALYENGTLVFENDDKVGMF